jgi:hypothetical protein
MPAYQPTIETYIFIGAFFTFYIMLLAKRVVYKKVDLYDFFMLGSLGGVPFAFVLFPDLVSRAAKLIGVEFPFLILFGGLSAVSFFMTYRLIRRVNKLKRDVTILIQRVGIMGTDINHIHYEDRSE